MNLLSLYCRQSPSLRKHQEGRHQHPHQSRVLLRHPFPLRPLQVHPTHAPHYPLVLRPLHLFDGVVEEGEVVGGEGAFGLAQGVLVAGLRGVVAREQVVAELLLAQDLGVEAEVVVQLLDEGLEVLLPLAEFLLSVQFVPLQTDVLGDLGGGGPFESVLLALAEDDFSLQLSLPMPTLLMRSSFTCFSIWE